jgi:general secretion pathway protein E
MSGPTLTLEWLVGVLEQRKLIDAATAGDLRIRAPEQRARLARAQQTAGSGAKGVGVGELVASFDLHASSGELLDEDHLASVLAEVAGLPYHRIDPLELDMGFITSTLSRPFALRHIVLPLKASSAGLLVAVENPFDAELAESLARIVKGQVQLVVSSRRDILKAITETYGFHSSIESAARETPKDGGSGDFEQLVKLRNVGDIEATDQHVVNAVDFLLRYAFDQRASDIHIEPKRGDSIVRLRIDGVLHVARSFPRQVHPAIISRIKMLSRMDIAEKRRPQDGRVKTVFGDSSIELRVSTMPVAFGEKVVIRIFDPDALLQDIPDLGFDAEDLAVFQRWIAEPHGLILITGPTGSGKTTTLYTTLKALAADDVNVSSVEDPIEMVTDHFNQVAAQPKIGIDFASALRTMLRQDPDIIMVGEIRDAETAEMAVQAALTGHLVLSTLHTNDSVGAITRMVDLNVPHFLVSSTLLGVMAQRLVRRVCKDCKRPAPLTADQRSSLGIDDHEAARFAGTVAGVGCVNCRGTGYHGRIGIFEVLDVTGPLAALVQTKAGEDRLRDLACRQGMRTLRACALERLAQGMTTFEEVIRITGARADHAAPADVGHGTSTVAAR